MWGTNHIVDGQRVLRLSSFPSPDPPCMPCTIIGHEVQIYTDHLVQHYFINTSKFIKCCTIVWSAKLCYFLQNRVCLELKQFFKSQWKCTQGSVYQSSKFNSSPERLREGIGQLQEKTRALCAYCKCSPA